MSDQEIINSIQTNFPGVYPDNQPDVLIPDLEKMTPLIKKGLVTFLQSHQHEEINLLGYSVDKLKSEHGMNEVAAYLTLDWLVREPNQALASLNKGHDVRK